MRHAILLSSILFAVGCGSSAEGPPELAEVSGTVIRDGKPVPNLQVFFQPKAGGRFSSGKTDENGKFTLEYTKDESGVIPGEQAVYFGYIAQTPEEESDPPEPYASIVAKYGNAKETPLTIVVDKSVSDLELKAD